MPDSTLYLDNAASSWPKPPCVREAVLHYLDEVGANPGRSGHSRSIAAGRIVDSARERVAELFGAPDPLRVAFTANATEAINLALRGWLRAGDHVITTAMEHNAVMRPLRQLAREGIELTVLPCGVDGRLDPASVEPAIRPNTTLIVLSHASNVTGTVQPLAEVGQVARRRGLLLLVDSASTAGCLPIHMDRYGIDLLAFTGHKSLLGPTGTGGLVIGERVDTGRLQPLVRGGTGSRSESEEQPNFLPDRYESGTLNTLGLAGLDAALGWILERGVDALRAHAVDIGTRLIDGLRAIDGITAHGPCDARHQTATVSFSLAGISPSDAGFWLDDEFGIQCRVGLHCAPSAHRTIGTFPTGTVRFAPGAFCRAEDIVHALAAVRTIAGRRS